MGKSMALGGGGRFAKLKGQLAAKGAKDPGALAAYIGRKKYGAKKFNSLSHLPTGVSLSPKGDIGAHRQMESEAVGGFKDGPIVKASKRLR